MSKIEYENGYPRKATCDKGDEYSFIFTECGNYWYSINNDPMYRNNCKCPKCGKYVKIVIQPND